MLFAYNPLFRAYNESGLQMLANAAPLPGGPVGPVGAAVAPATVDPARAAAAAQPAPENLGGEWRPITIQVAAADLARTESVVDTLHRHGARVSQADGSAYLTHPQPRGPVSPTSTRTCVIWSVTCAPPGSRSSRSWAESPRARWFRHPAGTTGFAPYDRHHSYLKTKYPHHYNRWLSQHCMRAGVRVLTSNKAICGVGSGNGTDARLAAETAVERSVTPT